MAVTLESFPGIIRRWKEYAREYLGETDYLGNKLLINYNSWFSNKEYRINLAAKLGLDFDDRGIHEVAKWGPSIRRAESFDGLSFDGQATEMKVLERWKTYQDDPFYQGLFSDKELITLSERIFGAIPVFDQLLK
jgi:hypothetical protein